MAGEVVLVGEADVAVIVVAVMVLGAKLVVEWVLVVLVALVRPRLRVCTVAAFVSLAARIRSFAFSSASACLISRRTRSSALCSCCLRSLMATVFHLFPFRFRSDGTDALRPLEVV